MVHFKINIGSVKLNFLTLEWTYFKQNIKIKCVSPIKFENMKKSIAITLLFMTVSVSAKNITLPEGITYCSSEYVGNFEINWKSNTITLNLGGSDKYNIVKKAIDTQKSAIILTASNDFPLPERQEFKVFLSPSINYFRIKDRDTGLYEYQTAKLSCWNEKKL